MCLKMPIADKFIMCGQNCCKISQLLIVVFGVSSAALFMFDLLTISVWISETSPSFPEHAPCVVVLAASNLMTMLSSLNYVM